MTPQNFFCRLIAYLILASGVILPSIPTRAAVRPVPSAEFPNLTHAAAHVNPGDTILLNGQVFRETGPVRITTRLRIESGGGTATVVQNYLNDDFAGRIALAGTQATTPGVSYGAAIEAGEPDETTGDSVWYSWQAPEAGGVDISVSAGFPVHLQVYSGTTLAGLQVIRSDPNSVRFETAAGAVYQIRVSSESGQGGLFLLDLHVTHPANDNFASRIPLTGAVVITTNSTFGATPEPGEPAHWPGAGGKSAWWTWTAPTDGIPGRPVTFSTAGSLFDTVLAVYTGNDLASLVPVPGASNDNDPADLGGRRIRSSRVMISTMPGTTYQIAVAGGASGQVDSGYLRLDVDASVLNVSITGITNSYPSGAIRFDGAAMIANYGSGGTQPMRVSLVGWHPNGERIDLGPPFPLPGAGRVLPGATATLPLSLNLSPPTRQTDCHSPSVVYAVLEELVQADWIPRDDTAVLFEYWQRVGNCDVVDPPPIPPPPRGVGGDLPFPAEFALRGYRIEGPTECWSGSIYRFSALGDFGTGFLPLSGIVWRSVVFTNRFNGQLLTNGQLFTRTVTNEVSVGLAGDYNVAGYVTSATNYIVVHPTLKAFIIEGPITAESGGIYSFRATGDYGDGIFRRVTNVTWRSPKFTNVLGAQTLADGELLALPVGVATVAQVTGQYLLARSNYVAARSVTIAPRIPLALIRPSGAPPSRLQLTWHSRPGRSYRLEATASLPALSWRTIQRLGATGTVMTVEQPIPRTSNSFFRVVEE